jgi:hypothetical protein
MRFTAIVMGLVLALGASSALAGPAQKATGGVRFITDVAQGQTEGDEAMVSFNAQANGPKGQIQVRVTRPSTGELVQRWHGEVDCYMQTGSTATFSGRVTKLELGTNTNEGMFFKLTATDGGEGRNAAPDEFAMQRRMTDPGCAQPFMTNTNFAGNIQVHG